MSALLYRFGRWCAEYAVRVLAAWLLIILMLGGAVVLTGGKLNNTFTISGTESMTGLDILAQRLPQSAGTSEQVLITADDGDIENHRDAVDGFVQSASDLDGVALVSQPFGSDASGSTPATASTVSDDGAHVLIQIQADISVGSMTSGQTDKAATLSEALDELVAATEAGDPDLTIQLGGTIGESADIGLGPTELIGVGIAAVVLLATFGSVVAAGAPLVAAFIGVGVGMLGILLAASATSINSTTPVLAVMIGLAVGIDYALFIISRAREYLADGVAPDEAAGRAVATSGSAVVFAGTTVILALCGLSVARIPFLTVMGVASAAVVAVAVAVALSVVPALIGVAGTRMRPSRRRVGRGGRVGTGGRSADRRDIGARRGGRRAGRGRTAARSSASRRWVGLVTRRPWATIAVVVVILGTAAVPARSLHLALTDDGFANKGTEQRETYDAIARVYGPGYNSPIIVIADIVTTTDPVGVVDDLADDLGSLPGVASIALATPNEDGSLGLVQIRPDAGQADEQTMDLVRAIRSRAADYEDRYGITDVMVTGQTAVAIDVSTSLNAALLPFGIVVVGLSVVLLMIVFRSVAVPLTATLGYVLSLSAGMGAAGAVWGWGWMADALGVSRTGAVISFMPVIVMGVLFGLAMDYEVFLVSRMREEWIRGQGRPDDARRAVESGFTGSAVVVGAAALIMTGVFAAFVPSHNVYVKPIAVALTAGIAADAFIVRMTLIPAVMAALGPRAWWLPRWLERQLPVIDVEGEGLERTLEHERWTAAHGDVVLRARAVTLADAVGAAVRDLDLTVAPGEVALVRAATPLARRALAAAIGGRLQPTSGVLVVDGHVLPDGTAFIQTVTTSVHAYDDDVAPHVRIVVVDDPGGRRWQRVAELAADGVAVVVTGGADMPSVAPVDVDPASIVDIASDGSAHTRRAPERRAVAPAQADRSPSEGESPGDPGIAGLDGPYSPDTPGGPDAPNAPNTVRRARRTRPTPEGIEGTEVSS